MPHLTAVLDANVLFPASLRDTLLRAVEEKLYEALWSDQIVKAQAADMSNPPLTSMHVLDTLAQHAPRFVELARARIVE